MAKIRINGDTSGYIELSAPNVAGSTSITLPATTGGSLLATDASGNLNVDSGTLYVDGVNNIVGIGTTSPVAAFKATFTGNYGIRVQNQDSNQSFLNLGVDPGSGYAFLDVDKSGSGTALPLRFGTGGLERMRLSTDGKLGIGITNPNASLHIGGNNGIEFGSRATEARGEINYTNAGEEFLDIKCRGTVSGYGNIRFYTDNVSSASVAKIRIENRGIVYGYSTDAGYIQGLSNGSGTTYRFFGGRHSSTGVDGSGTETYRVYSNGNVQNTNGSYTTISDVKFKENIVDAGSQWDDFKQIKIRNWNFKKETGYDTHRQIGPIAQEIEEICPGLVFETVDLDEKGNDLGTVTKGVNQSVLYMKAVKALQEAQLRIEQLEATNASFEARLSALEVKP